MKNTIIASFLSITILFSCGTQQVQQLAESHVDTVGFAFASHISYAKCFSIEQKGAFKVVTLHDPWKPSASYAQYALVPHGLPMPADSAAYTACIRVPVSRVVSISATHIGPLRMLGCTGSLVACSHPSQICDSGLYAAYLQNKIANAGEGMGINRETVLSATPDVVFKAGFQGSKEEDRLLFSSGVPVAYNIEWQEQSLLGRAEWIKFFAAFYCKERLADSLFNAIASRYNAVKNSALSQKTAKPADVLSGHPYNGIWFMPGGRSYVSCLLRDAGAQYHWSADTSTGSLSLSLETVLSVHGSSSLWLGADASTFSELVARDRRLFALDCVKEKNVYSMLGRLNARGGNEYWETGVCMPDVLLKDIVSILHPHIFPGYKLYFYKKIVE